MNLLRNKNNVITYTVNKAVNTNFNISVQNGEVVINAPWYTTNNQIQKILKDKKQWILNKIYEYEQNCEKKKEYTKLKTVKVLGSNYDLKVNYKNIKAPSLEIETQNINVILPAKYKKIENSEVIEIIMNKMYEKIAAKEIEVAMEKTRIMTGIAPEDYEIKRIDNVLAKCINGKIIINPDIAVYAKETIEYIVLHEFCHLKYKNHTKSFYNMLETYMPDYENYVNEISKMKY